MDGFVRAGQVPVQSVRVERCDGRNHYRKRLQARVQRLIGAAFVVAHFALPKATARLAHVPVREVVDGKRLDCTGHLGGLQRFIGFGHLLNQRIQAGQHPPVNLGAIGYWHLIASTGVAIDVGIQGEEIVGVVQRAEELSLNLGDAVRIEFEVVPRLSVGNHVPAGRVGAVLAQGLERIHGVAQSLGHLLAVLIQDQAIADNVFVRYGIEDHRGNRVQRVEPAAGLVHALRNEVGRVRLTRVDFFFVFKRVMPLGIRHGPAVKPDVN